MSISHASWWVVHSSHVIHSQICTASRRTIASEHGYGSSDWRKMIVFSFSGKSDRQKNDFGVTGDQSLHGWREPLWLQSTAPCWWPTAASGGAGWKTTLKDQMCIVAAETTLKSPAKQFLHLIWVTCVFTVIIVIISIFILLELDIDITTTFF